MNEACPICGQTKKPLKKSLYDYAVCRKCWAKVINRRQVAYIVDSLLMSVMYYLAIGMISAVEAQTGGGSSERFASLVVAVAYVGTTVAFLGRDTMQGRSPGKLLCGIQTIDRVTGEPIGFQQSFKRMLPVLIPIVPLIMAFQINKGPRWGDKWARSKVIWLKYPDSPVFASEATAREVAPEFGTPYVPPVTVPESDNPYRSPIG
jgi:uncharacterized RDD family membrane protein YckC